MKGSSKTTQPTLDQVLKKLQSGPFYWRQLLKAFRVQNLSARKHLTQLLNQLVQDKKVRNVEDCYVHSSLVLEGVLELNPKGFGFCACEGRQDDVFLPPDQVRGLFANDRLLIMLKKDRQRKSGSVGHVLNLLERQSDTMIGEVLKKDKKYYLVGRGRQSNHRFPIKAYQGIKVGQLIEARLVVDKKDFRHCYAHKLQVLSAAYHFTDELFFILSEFGISRDWPEGVSNKLDDYKSIHQKLINDQKRIDLTAFNFVTIDGDDAKDFDDAVFCEQKDGGLWHLMVAIADVSSYVKKDTMLDEAAYLRGNSVYLPNFVVPMLPEVLSNDLCSLNPKVKRAVMVCDLYWNEKSGKVESYQFYEGVILSKCRLTYGQVESFLSGKPLDQDKTFLSNPLTALSNLHKRLRAFREKRGVFDIQSNEIKVLFKNQQVVGIESTPHLTAHQLIEESMLLANVCAASALSQSPAIYRVHDQPSQESLETLKDTLDELGIKRVAIKTLADFQTLLTQNRDHPCINILQMQVLRTMQRAIYSTNNLGHFGLNYPHYTHFTSPIRRYPDLVVHRLLKAMNKKSRPTYTQKTLENTAKHCSATERAANQATWEAEAFYQCVYMKNKIGQKMQGVISGMNHSSVFVQVKNPLIEGALPRRFSTNDLAYNRGQMLEVELDYIDWARRRIMFKQVK